MKTKRKTRVFLESSDIARLKEYLERVEFFRKLNMPLHPIQPNWLSDQQAREISGWLSIYEHGTDKALCRLAEISLISFLGKDHQ
jgi:hypothetical protein